MGWRFNGFAAVASNTLSCFLLLLLLLLGVQALPTHGRAKLVL